MKLLLNRPILTANAAPVLQATIAAPQEEMQKPFMVQAAAVSRAVSTLQQNPEFSLPRGTNRSAFLYFFNNQTKAQRTYWTFASLVASLFTPEDFPFTGTTKATHKKYAKIAIQDFSKLWTELGLNSLINIRKNDADKTFDVVVPVMAIRNGSFGNVLRYLGAPDDRSDLVFPSLPEQMPKTPITGSTRVRGNLATKDIAELSNANAVLIPRMIGGHAVFLMHYTATAKEVSFLVNEKFDLIKPMDVYGPVFEWVGTYYGQYGRSPAFSLPIRQISRSVSKMEQQYPSTPRLNEDGLLMDEHADIYWMPREINDVQRFEDVYSDAFAHESGVFGYIDVMTEGADLTVRKKAPTPMPVFADWLNMKLAYTNAEGRLNVMNLDRTYPVNEVHIHRWLKTRFTSDRASNFVSQAISLAAFYGTSNGLNIQSFQSGLAKYASLKESAQPEDIRLEDIAIYATEAFGDPFPMAQQFMKMCTDTIAKIEESPETAYARYSVLTILSLRAGMVLMSKYGPRSEQMKQASSAKLKPYTEQGLDPDFKLDSVPYIGSHMAFLPHQTRVLNRTRNRPDNILYPIEAGGGKTPIAIFEILREMKSGNKGPYVVMCPSHLVAQYVKELVYVTEGRLNVIPITTYTIRRHGFDRLKAMIEASPVNTVLLTDYNVITLRNKAIAYGTTSVRIFPVIEFIRQFSPQVWFSDETHYLKSESSRQTAVHRLIADIPKKRGMSGTFVADTIKDLVKQAALFDPSIFGTVEDFVKEYALEVRGTKVLQWKEGTEQEVKSIMEQNFVMAEAKRKEWAAILPKPIERFHKVDLTDNQYKVYNQILQQVVDAIQAEIEKNESLRALLTAQDPDGDGEFEDAVVSIDQLLKPYLARLERFITAPGKDVLGAEVLKGEDLISPKAKKIAELASEHVRQGTPGKVLIFTNYTLSAEAIVESFDADMRDKVIHYTVDRKEEFLAQFDNDDSKQILVGVEQSLNTGGNLQKGSRLIRTETVWTPGVLEQGNARIGRPNIKNAETRSEIIYDWVISNKTIDVTKISYLMAKTISRAKYEEAGNERFDKLEVPPLFAMTLDTITESNNFDDTMLDYYDKYAAYKQAMFDEYADYREKNKTTLFNEQGQIRMTRTERSENLPESKLILRVPYVPGTELYKASDLGVVRYDEYMRLMEEEEAEDDAAEGEDGETGAEEDDSESEADQALKEEREKAIGLGVHTDRGDGTIAGVGRRTLRVELASGEKITIRKMSAFIITRAETSNKDVRTQLLKMLGDVPLDAPVESLESQLTDRKRRMLDKEKAKEDKLEQRKIKLLTPSADAPKYRIEVGFSEDENGDEYKIFNVVGPDGHIYDAFDRRRDAVAWIQTAQNPQPEEEVVEEESSIPLNIEFTVVNDILGMRLVNTDNQEAVDLAQTYGFKFSPAYYAVEIPTPQHMLKLFQKWKDTGFTMPKENSTNCATIYQRLLKGGRKNAPNTYGFATSMDLKNFYREEFKPNPKESVIMPYPIIQDERIYIALPMRGHPSSVKAIQQARVPGLKWMKFDAGDELILFTTTKPAATRVIHKMLDNKVNIENIAEMRKQFKSLKMGRDQA